MVRQETCKRINDLFRCLVCVGALLQKPQQTTLSGFGIGLHFLLGCYKLFNLSLFILTNPTVFKIRSFCAHFLCVVLCLGSLSGAQRSLHAACEGKANAHPLLSFLLSSSSSVSLCSAIHTSNYRVCDGYYNTDLPG